MRRTFPGRTDLFRHGDAAARTGGASLDFSVNVNPLGPPRSVLAALRAHLAAVARYPDPECVALSRRLAARHGVAPSQVVVGNGSNDLIYAAARAFRPRRVAIVEPTYTEYLRASRLAGATVDHWLAEGDAFEPQPFDPSGAEVVWLCNPNNPTGRLWQPRTLRDWIAAHARTSFVVDEAFLPFRDDEAAHSLIPHVDRLPNVVVLRSLTKLYALPGLRLGYAVASEMSAHRLRAERVPWSVNALAQGAGLAALDDEAYLAETHAWLAAERGSLLRRLAEVSAALKPLPTESNFVLLWTASSIASALAERGIVVRDASNFVGLDERYFRVAVRTAADNRRLLDELGALLPAVTGLK
jgi:threonine-phosphate decarboxylase